LVGYPAFGPCLVAACTRDRDGRGPYCHAHDQRWRLDRRRSDIDEEYWRRTAPAVAQDQEVSLRGLPPRVVAEIIYGLQQRSKEGILSRASAPRTFADLARSLQVSSVEEIPIELLTRFQRGLRKSIVTACRRVQTSPEQERGKDVWDAAVFGHTGTLRFTEISQPWLREAVKGWCFDDLPRRRGKGVRSTVQMMISAVGRLSESMRLQREDAGEVVTAVSRADITAYLNRMAYLQHEGIITANKRFEDCKAVRQVLHRMRSMGLTRPGAQQHGLPDDFVLSMHDMPDLPEDTEAGRDLPPEVIRHLCQHLHLLEEVSPLARVAVELLIDTGRRPEEISSLGADCLERDSDGKPVLIYDNHKALRNARRLPISEATAKLITAQQARAQSSFPDKHISELKLLPTLMKNPHGAKAITSGWISTAHRKWVHGLPDILVPVTLTQDRRQVTTALPFDKNKIFLYAYRHSYAQRHADAGVPVDVLRQLMDHRLLETTQCYYRVGEERRREAVERVTVMQFDRHGNRIWRQAKALLDSEHARRSVGEVATAYGGCTEPSNVAAGGHACPFRFRCVGCSHFRTDISYLPDLEAYLADLLRSRERLLAAVDVDEWARAEAMPSDEEITRVRRLISRMKQDIDDLGDEEKAQIMEAVTVVRRHRQGTVALGMPKVRQPLPDVRPDRVA
jgi:hypothetical protein